MLNETLWVMIYTAKMMATLPEKNNTGNVTVIQDTRPMSLLPEEMGNQTDLHDNWHDWTKTRCYNPYGCFSNDYPWSGEQRPVFELPEDPRKINPRYFFYTRDYIEQPYELKIDDFETIRNSPLRARNNLYFIIHGFLENGDQTWVTRTMKELLLREECNVVIVNWIAGARPPYAQAVANTRIVGAMTARLAAQLIEIGGMSAMNVHVIGHSLGGHTAGYVGHKLRTEYGHDLARIIGLDPAEPHFKGTEALVRLDPTDATFVTAIHTDSNPFISGGLGITQPVAHIDFYPNGGRNQPGCNEGVLNSISSENGSVFRGIKKFLGCNHIRSYEYFIESINSPCPFLSVPCSSWDKFQEGGCFDCVNQYCPRFGLDAQPGNYRAAVYLMTGSEKPFCKGHYKVTINTSKNNDSMSHGGEIGMFVVRAIGANGKKTERMKLNHTPKYYEPGSTHTAVLSGDIVDQPNSVEITWEYETSVFNPLTWRILTTPRVYIDSVIIESLETNYEVTLCPDNMKTLIANQPKILTAENCRIMEHNVVST